MLALLEEKRTALISHGLNPDAPSKPLAQNAWGIFHCDPIHDIPELGQQIVQIVVNASYRFGLIISFINGLMNANNVNEVSVLTPPVRVSRIRRLPCGGVFLSASREAVTLSFFLIFIR